MTLTWNKPNSNIFLVMQDAFGAERRKAKMLNFSIAYGKTAHGLARDWKVTCQTNITLS
jgi:DNA polymerase I-like protein with 3'-5' exonuclease and polymerase domains